MGSTDLTYIVREGVRFMEEEDGRFEMESSCSRVYGSDAKLMADTGFGQSFMCMFNRNLAKGCASLFQSGIGRLIHRCGAFCP